MLNDDSVSDLITINGKDNSDKNDETKEDLRSEPDQKTSNDNEELTNEENEDKLFTVNDIQTLIDNQLLHKSQLDQNLDNKLEQQHLILVTQNGDKIILIQNPSSISDNRQSVQLNNGNSNTDNAGNAFVDEVGVNSINQAPLDNNSLTISEKSIKLINNDSNKRMVNFDTLDNNELLLANRASRNLSDEQDNVEEELNRIQMQHKIRQQSLMLQLEKLKEKQKQIKNEDNQVTGEDNFWEFNIDETNEYERQKSNHKSSKQYSKRKSVPLEKFYCEAKWFPSFCNNLEKAHNHIRRRTENIEQLSKYYPTASYAFESRCAELKKHLKKLELNLERFQNVLGKDLNFVENKLKNFFQDYHLEQFSAEIEEEDRKDLDNQAFSSSLNNAQFNNSHNHQLINFRNNRNYSHNVSRSSIKSSKMELITPLSISIKPTVIQNERETTDEIDPVREIRDIQCDASLEEMYSNTNKLKKTMNLSSSSKEQPVVINIKTKKISKHKNSKDDLKPVKYQKRS